MPGGLGIREHLDELRHRLKVTVVSLALCVILVLLLPLRPGELLNLNAVYYTTPVSIVLQTIKADILPSNWVLIPFHIGAPLEILIFAALILGLTVDMPVISYEIYKFVDPALKPAEREMVYPVVLSATGLFVVGILFGYFVLAKFIFIAMAPFYTVVGISPPYIIEASDFYAIVFLSVAFSGVAFVTPVFAFLLIRFGVLSPRFFSKYRAVIWGATYIATAFITPDGGPVLDIILFVPVIALLEIAVLLGRRYAPSSPDEEEKKCGWCRGALDNESEFCPRCGRAVR